MAKPSQLHPVGTQAAETSAVRVYLRLLSYSAKHWKVFTLSIVSLLVLSATNTGFLATIRLVTDEGFVKRDATQFHTLPFILFGLMLVRSLAGFISSFSMRYVSRRVVEALRLHSFGKLMTLPVSFFDANSVGNVSSKITYDTEQISKAATNVAVSGVRDTFTIIGVVGYMLYLDWALTLIFLAVAPMMGYYLKAMTPRLREVGKNVQQTMGDMTQVCEEAISGQRIVKIFSGKDYEMSRFSAVAAANRRFQTRLARISGSNSMVIEILAAVALSLVVFYSVGKFTAGEFAAFIGALLMLIAPIKSMTSINEDLQQGLAAANSVFALIDEQPEIDDGQREFGKVKGHIEFREVMLRYPSAKHNALNQLSFNIAPGEKLALVGRSGGGKTTMVNLLPRFYHYQAGQILIDGVDTREFSLHSLRQQFALVSQDIVLFNDTVLNNIAYGSLRACTQQQVIEAAKAAHAWEFIEELPDGLHTMIGDRGVRLSGGQRQRLAIARAILKDAPILLLDEATSALDTESERHVQAALDQLMQGRTSIVIAHRLSTIENADRIIVMEKGTIVEQGNHAELLQRKGHYAKLYQKQFQQG